jgi:hypothetical protein
VEQAQVHTTKFLFCLMQILQKHFTVFIFYGARHRGKIYWALHQDRFY